MAWPTTLPTFIAGMTAGVAAGVQKLSDAIAVLTGARTSFTPTWTQSTTNPTLGNATLTGDYRQASKEVDFLIQLTIGSTTVLGTGTFNFALPVAARRSAWSVTGTALDVSSSTTIGIPLVAEATTTGSVALRQLPATAGGQLQVVNQTQPFAWAVGDVITIQGRYEAA